MPSMYVMFKPGYTMQCTKEINFGGTVIPKDTLGVVETVSIDRREDRHYTIYFDKVLMDGLHEEEDVPYTLTADRIKNLGIRLIQVP